MKKSIFYSILLCSCLYSSENTEKETFIDKYIGKEEYKKTQAEIDDYRKNISKDVNIKEISKKENRQIDTTIPENKNNLQAEKIAENINNEVKSKDFQNKVDGYKDYIFKDKDLNFDAKMGNYKKEIASEKEKTYKNKILNSDERLIIAISSSIPDEVIKNYFKALGDNHDDILFVMNGFIGNDPKKIMPTLEYISTLLNKDDSKDIKSKNKYLFRVDINPKLFAKYNIQEVPAVIFVKNYNPYLEIQGNGAMTQESDENVFISYGDSSLVYALEKINKKAKSDGLDKFIKNLSKGFFK